ncbi:hypothetical protein [Micromonospora sp. CPCC 205556]|uniref:hypothetical protein n=1 Tax=Micromonospora sp. CPCC 205556 TaxID=3122398 RepID=UPI002FF1C030
MAGSDGRGEPRRRSRTRPLLAAAVAAALAVLTPTAPVAYAADLAMTNSGFESGLSGWTQFAAGGNSASAERAYQGTLSAKIVDTSAVDGTGLESGRSVATAGTRYTAFARIFVEVGGIDLYLRFYDSGGTLVGNHYAATTAAPGTWAAVQVSGTAPAGTTRMSVLPYSGRSSVATAYVDQVSLSAAVTDLGVQIDTSQINGTTFGIGAHQDKAYGIFTGSNDHATNPARFGVIDVDTASIVGSTYPLTGAIGGWAATTASDGSVYLGSYSNGHLYRHVPGGSGVTDLGQAMAGEEFVWCLTPGTDGRIYGGTYRGAGYFKYEPAHGFTQLGSKPIWPGRQYVRSIAFDPVQGATYLGVGTNAALIRFDRVTGAKQDILPAKYADISMVGNLTHTGGRLFASMANGTMSVLNVTEHADGTVTAVEEASFGAKTVSPARDGRVHFVASGGVLSSYDIATRQVTPVGVTVTGDYGHFGWVSLADQAGHPGQTLVVIGNEDGRTVLLKYNPTNGASSVTQVTGTPTQPTHINALATGPDGNIYTGGYLSGATGMYRPLSGDGDDSRPDQLYRGLSQTDSMTSYAGKLYVGTYSGAKVHEYDPGQPWRPGTNPRQLVALAGDGQDRPVAITAGGGRLFVGTVAGYGRHDGALTVYDLASGAHTVLRNIVPDQSVVALAYHGGKVWGGSTIRGALGVDTTPKATEAKLFSHDPATGVTETWALPPTARKLTAITALAVVDGRIWGMAEGYLFVFDPATRTFTTAPTQKFPEIAYTYGSWSDAELLTIARDPAHVYGTIGDHVFKINKSTLAVTKLVSTGVNGLTADEHGNLYYSRYDRLHRYVP